LSERFDGEYPASISNVFTIIPSHEECSASSRKAFILVNVASHVKQASSASIYNWSVHLYISTLSEVHSRKKKKKIIQETLSIKKKKKKKTGNLNTHRCFFCIFKIPRSFIIEQILQICINLKTWKSINRSVIMSYSTFCLAWKCRRFII